MDYNTDLFDASTIGRMLGHFQRVLEGVAADPDRRLADLPLLTEAERYQLLVEWNATGDREQGTGGRSESSDSWLLAPDSSCIHELFAAQAARVPDAIAVVFEGPADDEIRD